MFTQKQAMFIYTVSPLHMGTGATLGLIDNPIQREVHTEWPSMAGSGIKGALRHAFTQREEWNNGKLDTFFGPESSSNDLYAGAVSFTDAQIVCFPVRSLRRAFVYATCPTAIARLARLTGKSLTVPTVKENEALIANDELKHGEQLILEALAFDARKETSASEFGKWLAESALPTGFFADKIRSDLVILSDTDFSYFVRNSTFVEPHVRIDDDTGTAKDGGLFYTENLPPETLLAALVLASDSRTGGRPQKQPAQTIMADITKELVARDVWQFGGDSTTGRGLVTIQLLTERTPS